MAVFWRTTTRPAAASSLSLKTAFGFAGLWQQNIIQSSKIIVPGEPVQFSDLPSFQVPLPVAGACTGIAAQDGTLVAFTATAIYSVQGLGPNDQGRALGTRHERSPVLVGASIGAASWPRARGSSSNPLVGSCSCLVAWANL